jgi:hypothetical protein
VQISFWTSLTKTALSTIVMALDGVEVQGMDAQYSNSCGKARLGVYPQVGLREGGLCPHFRYLSSAFPLLPLVHTPPFHAWLAQFVTCAVGLIEESFKNTVVKQARILSKRHYTSQEYAPLKRAMAEIGVQRKGVQRDQTGWQIR